QMPPAVDLHTVACVVCFQPKDPTRVLKDNAHGSSLGPPLPAAGGRLSWYGIKNSKAGGQFPARLAVNIWNDRDGRFDHLPPVMAMPWMNCFWKIRYSTTMGIMASRLPAISTGKLVLYCPFSVERPADSVIMFRSVLQISGHIRSE